MKIVVNLKALAWIATTAFIVLIGGRLALGYLALKAFSAGSFFYPENQITKQIENECTPDFVAQFLKAHDSKLIKIRNVEGLRGGQLTLRMELLRGDLEEFLHSSPFKDVQFRSDRDPFEFHSKSWLSDEKYNEIKSKQAYLFGEIKDGRRYSLILIDCTRTDRCEIYIQITS